MSRQPWHTESDTELRQTVFKRMYAHDGCRCYALSARCFPLRARTLVLYIGAVVSAVVSRPERHAITCFPHSLAIVSAKRSAPIDDKLVTWVRRLENDLYYSAGSRVCWPAWRVDSRWHSWRDSLLLHRMSTAILKRWTSDCLRWPSRP